MILMDDMWLKSTDFLGSESAFTFKVVIQLGSVLLQLGSLENVFRIITYWKTTSSTDK